MNDLRTRESACGLLAQNPRQLEKNDPSKIPHNPFSRPNPYFPTPLFHRLAGLIWVKGGEGRGVPLCHPIPPDYWVILNKGTAAFESIKLSMIMYAIARSSISLESIVARNLQERSRNIRSAEWL